MNDQVRKTWDKSAISVYVVIALLLAVGFGYSLCAISGRAAMVELADQQRKERSSMIKLHKAEVSFLRERNMDSKRIIEKQSDQLAKAGMQSSETAQAAVEVVKKQTPEATK